MPGAAYGLRQALDTVGAFVGPLLAMGLMLLWANDYRAGFLGAALPAVLAVLLLYVGVREPAVADRKRLQNPITRANLRQLRASYRWLLAVAAGLTLARTAMLVNL